MAKRESAGILLYKINNGSLLFFLVHHGGPFWMHKDAGAWTIPKGEVEAGEMPLQTAMREFKEETGTAIEGHFIPLTPVLQKAGKKVYAWALEGDIDPQHIQCNSFTMEWPPKSGNWQQYPEVDKGAWFDEATAKVKINSAQTAFIDELLSLLAASE